MVKEINNKLHIQFVDGKADDGTVITEKNITEEMCYALEEFELLGSSYFDATIHSPYTGMCYDIVFIDSNGWTYRQSDMERDLIAGKEVVIEGRKPDDTDIDYLVAEYGYTREA